MNADQHGFLIPDRRLSFDESVPTLKGIKRDTSTVIRLLKGQVRSNVLQQARRTNPNASTARAASIATPGAPSAAQAARGSWSGRPRDERGRFVAAAQRAGDPIGQAVRQLTRQQAQQVAAQQRADTAAANQGGARQEAAATQARDARGRFGAGDGRGDDGERGGGRGGKDSMLARLKDAFPSHVGSDLEKIDPAIEAANELRSLTSGPLKTVGVLGKAVLGRGLKAEKQDVAVPWYRRILAQLKIMRREDRADSKAELSAIGGVHVGSSSGNSGGILSALGGLLPAGAQAATASIGGLLKLLGKVGLPVAAIASAAKSFNTDTGEYADRMGVKDDGSLGKGLAIRSAGVLGDLGNTLTFGLADKLGKSDVMTNIVDKTASILSKLNPNYRHKESFSGFQGAAGLSSEGTYTDAEAARIRELKGSGANTSANLPQGMPRTVRDKIVAQASAAGVDANTLLKFAAMESGGNANAISPTGAIGLFQMTGKTATKMGIKDRFNQDQNIAGGIALMKENQDILLRNHLPATTENLYMMHQLGSPTALEVLRGAAMGKNISDLSPAAQSSIGKNYGKDSITAADYLGVNSAALNDRASKVIGKSASNVLPATASTSAVAPVVPTAVSAPPRTSPFTAPMPQPPSPPPPPPNVEQPVKLSSNTPLVVSLANEQLISQDISSRRLASIATGGLSDTYV